MVKQDGLGLPWLLRFLTTTNQPQENQLRRGTLWPAGLCLVYLEHAQAQRCAYAVHPRPRVHAACMSKSLGTRPQPACGAYGKPWQRLSVRIETALLLLLLLLLLASCCVMSCSHCSATDLAGRGTAAAQRRALHPSQHPAHLPAALPVCRRSATDLNSGGLQKRKDEHCRARDFCVNCMPGDDREGGQGKTKCWPIHEPILYKVILHVCVCMQEYV